MSSPFHRAIEDETDRLRIAEQRERSVTSAAVEWADARLSFLSLGAGHPDAKGALNRLANAEDKLCRLAIPEAYPD